MIAIYGTGEAARNLRRRCEELNLPVIFHIDRKKPAINMPLTLTPDAAQKQIGRITYLVIASAWHEEIEEWLGDFYPDLYSRIVSAEALGSIEVLGSKLFQKNDFPSVVFLSHDRLTPWHGVGLGMERYLGWIPRQFKGNIYTNGENIKDGVNLRIAGHLNDEERITKINNWQGLKKNNLTIYSTAFTEHELKTLKSILTEIKPKPRIIQHFTDFLPLNEEVFIADYQTIANSIDHHLVYDETLYDYLSARMPAIPFRLITTLAQSPSNENQGNHFTANLQEPSGFVMIGNIWNVKLLDFINSTWSELGELGSMRPINWHSHPASLERVISKGAPLPPLVSWQGYAHDIVRTLRNYEVGLIFVGDGLVSRTNYERYSVPSRIIDFMISGIPFIVIGPKDSAAVKFAERNNVGAAVVSSRALETAADIYRLLQDREWIEKSPAQALAVFKRDFTLGSLRLGSCGFVEWLYRELAGLDFNLPS